MNLFTTLREHVIAALDRLVSAGKLPAGLDFSRVTAEPPRETAHGDAATNAAMVLAKAANMKPRDIAELLAAELRAVPAVTSVEIAGPGFINLRLDDTFWRARLKDVLRAGASYGDCNLGAGQAINVEYVSANPTGPLHVGHGRGAVFGDALANLLDKAGFKVSREYYINDAGAQVDVLARSTHLRYREALGENIGAIPEGLYPGDYLIPVGQAIAKADSAKWQGAPESEWLPEFRKRAIAAMLELIKDDLGALGVRHAVFASERALIDAGRVDQAQAVLAKADLTYTGVLEPPKGKLPDDWEPKEQLLFRATKFGDEVDRPLKKSDGSWTYFASDIAYHLDKYQRGFARMVDVWGADHGGYVKRVQAAVTALTEGKGRLDVKLVQLVALLKDGQPYKMSKRAGTFVTLRDVIDEVGKDVVRFIMLTRKNDAQLDFDVVKVQEQSKDNPVFYVQYAHARAHSVLRKAAELFPGADLTAKGLADGPLDRLTDPAEIALIKVLAGWPRLIEGAAEAEEPHRIAFYLYDVAAALHGLWTMGKDDATLRFLVESDRDLSLARMALVQAVASVVASGLAVFGVQPVEEMR
ncbi:MAG TPA: arginine--tRNA ligase [Magnetospirillaceae bacterium]|jgi:arginyl-tRNA synthetase